MTHLPRVLGLAALALLAAACDSTPSAASANTEPSPDTDLPPTHDSTDVSLPEDGAHLRYRFRTLDNSWDGTFSVTTFDDTGNEIVTYTQDVVWVQEDGEEDSRLRPRYGVNFSWSPDLPPTATVHYLAENNGTFIELAVASSVGGGDGDSDTPSESMHTLPNGSTRLDFPRPEDPADPWPTVTRTRQGDTVRGVTDIALRFPENVKVPVAVMARFRYPTGVRFVYRYTEGP